MLSASTASKISLEAKERECKDWSPGPQLSLSEGVFTPYVYSAIAQLSPFGVW
jgi:hypothetical protein